MLFPAILRSIIRDGSLCLIEGDGRQTLIGNGTGVPVTVRLARKSLNWTLAFDPALSVGEAFMNGDLVVEQGTVYDLLALLARNIDDTGGGNRWLHALEMLRHLVRRSNSAVRARANVSHHYDLSSQLYDLFLDTDRQYSCAYFAKPTDTLEQAQAQKTRHIAAKLLLDRPDLKVLDIGSGWGGLGLYLAEEAAAEVTGVTLSTEQHAMSNARAEKRGLANRARFHLRDYRHETGVYDRIVSVGMFEHVGKRNWQEFFNKLGTLLHRDGVALVHTIGYWDTPGPINPFIKKYIFPGADLPALSEMTAAAARAGLIVTDVEVLRLHYAETLRLWRERFMARRDEAAALYDERFCRMWEFYLALCEVGFRYRTTVIYQVQLTKHLDALPITRDYMVDWEREHASEDAHKSCAA
jgi:cyclopropane-fatty-acyl-phospholipid synthase